MSRLSLEDRILLVELYFTCGKSVTEAIRKFSTAKNIKRASEAPSRSTVTDLVAKFHSTGSVADMERPGRPSLQEMRSTAVQQVVDEHNGQVSSVAISRETNIPQSSVLAILHQQLHLYPYRIHLLQSITDADKQHRLEFANDFLLRHNNDSHFIGRILWTDEAHFHLNGEINTWNCRIWAKENPNESLEEALNSPKVTVWAGFNSRFILPPYFFEENGTTVTIDSERYCKMLVEHLIPLLKARHAFSTTILQQDGATPHTARITKHLLQLHFGSDRIISRGFRIDWPARSPDLNGCDFWLWGYLKARVYSYRYPMNCAELKDRIKTAVEEIPREMLEATVNSVIPRMELCVARRGGHINPDYN